MRAEPFRLFAVCLSNVSSCMTVCETLPGLTQVRVAVGGQSKRTAEAEGRENLDWEETMVCMAT